jgi:hypothetical protein
MVAAEPMREERLARAFVEFSGMLVRGYDVVEFLSWLCRRSVEVLEATAAGACSPTRPVGCGWLPPPRQA